MKLLRIREVADQLCVSPSTVYLLVESGQIPHHRVGNRRGAIRVSQEQLAEYLAETRQERGNTISTTRKAPRARLKHVIRR